MIKLQKSTFYNEHETKRSLCEFITNAEVLSMGSECASLKLLSPRNKKERARFSLIAEAALTWFLSLMNLVALIEGM